jgi:hypothetical protein
MNELRQKIDGLKRRIAAVGAPASAGTPLSWTLDQFTEYRRMWRRGLFTPGAVDDLGVQQSAARLKQEWEERDPGQHADFDFATFAKDVRTLREQRIKQTRANEAVTADSARVVVGDSTTIAAPAEEKQTANNEPTASFVVVPPSWGDK